MVVEFRVTRHKVDDERDTNRQEEELINRMFITVPQIPKERDYSVHGGEFYPPKIQKK